jgi:ubiquinone/menaquinone biosynthesis C-methylase UbiE
LGNVTLVYREKTVTIEDGKLKDSMNFEEVMYDQTEWPGEVIPLEDLHVISHRYLRILDICTDADVLEIGGGSTIGKAEISEAVKSYVSIDISSQNVLRSKALCDEISLSLCQADAHRLPFRSGSFDTIIALAMMYYLDSEIFLKEARRVLRPGGRLFFCSSNKDVPGFVAAPGSLEYYSIPEWTSLLTSNGFSVSFEGVFPKSHVLPLEFRASLIRRLKQVLEYCGISFLWRMLRIFAKGSRMVIPESLSDFPASTEVQETIDGAKIDVSYRVIYCDCKRI